MPDSSRGCAIEARDLSFQYSGSENRALRKLSFSIAPGERIGLLGPNGAGKSTLMRLICGFLPAPAARHGTPVLAVDGLDVRRQSLDVRRRVGYLPELVPLYEELRVREHLEFRARIKGIARRALGPEIARVTQLVGLDRMLEAPIMRLSRGYRQRVGIADALLGAPPLVVLDEPTVGLDPNQVSGIRRKLARLEGDQTLIFSSHMLADVEALCDRILILAEGRLVADEAVGSGQLGRVCIEWEGSVIDEVRRMLSEEGYELGAGDDLSLVHDSSCTRLGLSPSSSASALEVGRGLGRASARRGLVVIRLEHGRARLEERFAQVTGHART